MPSEEDISEGDGQEGIKTHPSIISFSEALQEFIGNWAFDPKLSHNIPGTVPTERILKVAKVSLTKRIGLQYFVGNDVSQVISIDDEKGELHIDAFVKGIPSWSKVLFLDSRKVEVKDALFGNAISHTVFDAETKELSHVLDSNKVEKGRLSFIRTISDDTMTMVIRWFPSSEDPSIFISHHRIYTRKGPQVTLSDITKKARRKHLAEGMRDRPINTTIEMAADASKLAAAFPKNFAGSLSSRFRKNSEGRTSGDMTSRSLKLGEGESDSSAPSTPLRHSFSVPPEQNDDLELPATREVLIVPPKRSKKTPSSSSTRSPSEPVQSPNKSLLRALALPIGSFLFAIILVLLLIVFERL